MAGQRYAHDNRRGDDRLRNNHRVRCIKNFQKSQWPVAPDHNRDKQTHDNRRQTHPRVDYTDDQPLSAKVG